MTTACLHLAIALHRAGVALMRRGMADLARGLIGLDYAALRAGYVEDISAAMLDYLLDERAVTKFRNGYKRAVLEYFDAAYYTAFVDAGGQITQMSQEDRQWILDRMQAELGYVDGLFLELKALKKAQEGGPQDWVAIAMGHAGGYAKTLDGVYAQGYMRGGRDELYVFEGVDGYESCPECQKMKGIEHTAEWIISHDAIPYPGTSFYSCHGWRCEHYWIGVTTGKVLMG